MDDSVECMTCLTNPDSKFCPQCGRSVLCRGCQKFIRPEWNKCLRCNTPISQGGTITIGGNLILDTVPAGSSLHVQQSRSISNTVTVPAGSSLNVTHSRSIVNMPSDWMADFPRPEDFAPGACRTDRSVYVGPGASVGAIMTGDHSTSNVHVMSSTRSSGFGAGRTNVGVASGGHGGSGSPTINPGSSQRMGFQWSNLRSGELRKVFDDTSDIDFLVQIVELAKSVGCVWSPYGTGTAFRVGTDMIMTCCHVIRGVKEHLKQDSELFKNDKIWVQFNYRLGDERRPNDPSRFQFRALKYSNPNLDVAILQLDLPQGTNYNLPPPVTKFATATEGDRIQLVGHNKGHNKKLDPDCQVRKPTQLQIKECTEQLTHHIMNQTDFYQGMENPHRVHFQCGFEKGASGCPGVHRCHGGLSVVTMLAKGYPIFYFSLKEQEQKNFSLPNDYFVEEGIDMKAIFEDLQKKAPEVYNDIKPMG